MFPCWFRKIKARKYNFIVQEQRKSFLVKKRNILNFLSDRKSFLVKKKNIFKILSDWTFCLLDLLSGFTKHWTFCLLYQVSDWTICLCTFCPLYQVSFGPSVCLDLLSLYQASCTKCLWTKCLWTNCPGTAALSRCFKMFTLRIWKNSMFFVMFVGTQG